MCLCLSLSFSACECKSQRLEDNYTKGCTSCLAYEFLVQSRWLAYPMSFLLNGDLSLKTSSLNKNALNNIQSLKHVSGDEFSKTL